MSDLLQRLKLGTDNVKLIDWPGSETKVALRILSQQDLQDAAFSAERLFKTQKIETNLMTANDYEQEKVVQILYRALRDPEKLSEPIVSSISAFRSMVTSKEIDILSGHYVAFETECSPSPDKLSSDEFDKLLSEVKKTPDSAIGTITNIYTLRKLITSLVNQLSSSPTDSGFISLESKKQ
jgi:phage FluMu protein gp41